MARKLFDGYDQNPSQIGRAIIERPFRGNGDAESIVIRRRYKQRPEYFEPLPLKTPDADYPAAYLIGETDPQETATGLVEFVRTFATVPAQQSQPSSLFVTKPNIPGTFPQISGSSLIVQPDPAVARWIFYTQKTVSADSGPPVSIVSGGTFTLTFGADTTAAIAWNATAADVQTALNALTSVTNFGGVTVTGTYSTGFTITFTGLSTISANTGSTTAAGGTVSASVTPLQNGKVQSLTLTPLWSNSNPSAASSFTPSAANPISWSRAGGTTGIAFYRGNQNIYGAAATGGTYTLTFYGQTTAAIAWDASAATVAAAINALSEVSSRGGVTVSDYLLNGQPAFYADFGAPQITSGTYTLTLFGETTAAIAYNASTATIQTEINALSGVTARGGAIVSGTGFASGALSIVITFADIPAMSGSAASLTPSGSNLFVSKTTSAGVTQTASFSVSPSSVRTLTAFAHGISTSDTLLVTIDATVYEVAAGAFLVPDVNTITLDSATGLLSTPGTATTVGKQNGNEYTAGTKLSRISRVTDYYLPGVTPGINTADDIPLPTYQGDPGSLLAAILTGETSINYEVGELTQWNNSPILARTITTLNASRL